MEQLSPYTRQRLTDLRVRLRAFDAANPCFRLILIRPQGAANWPEQETGAGGGAAHFWSEQVDLKQLGVSQYRTIGCHVAVDDVVWLCLSRYPEEKAAHEDVVLNAFRTMAQEAVSLLQTTPATTTWPLSTEPVARWIERLFSAREAFDCPPVGALPTPAERASYRAMRRRDIPADLVFDRRELRESAFEASAAAIDGILGPSVPSPSETPSRKAKQQVSDTRPRRGGRPKDKLSQSLLEFFDVIADHNETREDICRRFIAARTNFRPLAQFRSKLEATTADHVAKKLAKKLNNLIAKRNQVTKTTGTHSAN